MFVCVREQVKFSDLSVHNYRLSRKKGRSTEFVRM